MPTVLGGRLALLAALALMGCALSTGAGSPPPSPPAPSANDAAPPGGDVAAYVSGGKLYLLSGGASRAVSVSGLPSGPRWSHDGAWVAYLLAPAPSGPGSGSQEVHLVRADGSGDHALPFVGKDFAWSPAADLLAFTTGGGAALALSPPDGGPTELVKAGPGTIDSFAWSPDGAALAYCVRPSSSLSASDQLFSVSSDGGRFQRWAYTPPGNTGLILAGW